MIEDSELLRRYVEEKSQAAFAELVERRVNLVYSVALRQVGGDAHLAQDVTQKVFVDLARKAAALQGRAVLSGWLYRSTQYAASDVVRSERRRRTREVESEALREQLENPGASTDWDKLRPMLDAALGELNDTDRDAVALRYFEGRQFAEVGRALRLSEEAARKRVERALDKLAGVLSRRGVTSSATALGAALGASALSAAPEGLAGAITTAALAGAGTSAVTGGTVASFLASTKVAIGTGVAAIVALGVAIQQGNRVREQQVEIAAMARQQAGHDSALVAMKQRLEAAERRAAGAEEDNAQLLAAIEGFRARVSSVAASGAAVRPGVGDGGGGVSRVEGVTQKSGAEEALTEEQVDQRLKRAQQLARSGHTTEALAEFLWLFDEGMLRFPRLSSTRRAVVMTEIFRLGEPGRAAMIARRDAVEKALMERSGTQDHAADVGAMNSMLKEGERTLALYDRLPEGDKRRRSLAIFGQDLFIEQQRYKELLAARSYSTMVSTLEEAVRERPSSSGSGESEASKQSRREAALRSAAKGAEVLAGAGDMANARRYLRRVLEYDNTESTRALLQRHLARAGAPTLLDEISPR